MITPMYKERLQEDFKAVRDLTSLIVDLETLEGLEATAGVEAALEGTLPTTQKFFLTKLADRFDCPYVESLLSRLS